EQAEARTRSPGDRGAGHLAEHPRQPAQAQPGRRPDPRPARAGRHCDARLQQASHCPDREEDARKRHRQCREQPPAGCRPARGVPRRGRPLAGDEALLRSRPRPCGARREVVQPSEDRGRREAGRGTGPAGGRV
ncbi:MAG: LSU ribosomal protein L22p (L17e), partial [uncultured Craurococcus sp.]